MSIQPLSMCCAFLSICSLIPRAHAAEEELVPELSQAGALIDYARDVQPILAAKCLKCHGPEEAKNDFRVDESESLLSYVEAGDADASSLWSDYLVTDDPDMRMPPASAAAEEQMTGIELATIKLWIEEGGKWNAVAIEPIPAAPVENLTMAQRIWKFQGLFHPATTHFPIALLTVSAAFVLLSFIRPDTCEPVAFHCLWIGALGAIVASAAGWSYADYEGYGAGFSFDLQNSAIDRHRWLGIGVGVLSLILIPVALYVRRTEDFGMRFVWLLGSVLLLGAVGTAGYQGGELTYGEGHYEKEFVKYFPNAIGPQSEDEPQQEENSDATSREVGDEPKDQDADSNEKSTVGESPDEPKDSADDEAKNETQAATNNEQSTEPTAEKTKEPTETESKPESADPEDSDADQSAETKDSPVTTGDKL